MDIAANTSVVDPTTGKAREADLTAKWIEGRGSELLRVRPGVGAQLLIECVRTETPLAFYEKPATFDECRSLRTLFGFPLHLQDPPGSSGYSQLEDLAGVSWWRSCRAVATQWHGFELKGGSNAKHVASQRHDIHGTFDKLLWRAEAAADQCMQPELILSAFLRGWLHFIRPVLVVDGPVDAIVLDDAGQRREARDQVHYIRASRFGDRLARWLIDVVREPELPAYLARLTSGMETVKSFCVHETDRVQAAIDSDTALRLSAMERAGPAVLIPRRQAVGPAHTAEASQVD